jgi:putative transposase
MRADSTMTYDPNKHHRRLIRWVGYDYSDAGAYFVTICVQDHLCLFGQIANDDTMRLNDGGHLVQMTQ